MSEAYKIMVIDDSKLSRLFIKNELQVAGYAVTECSDGEQAASAFDLSYDLIIMDITMPNLDGFETCKAIRLIEETLQGPEESKTVPVILVSATDTLENRTKGFLVGATDYIAKTEVRQHLVTIVNRILKPEAVFKDIRALVAEDSKTLRNVLIHHLQSVGVEIEAYEDGLQAYEALEKNKEGYDILLTDIVMPNMDGLELCQQVRTQLGLKDIPILFLTSEESPTILAKAFNVGATDYLKKPYLKEELLARISAHIAAVNHQKRLNNIISQLEEINESKNKLLAACSHDLKAPLGAIIGYVELIKEDYDPSPDLTQDLDSILKCTRVQMNLIQDILSLAKLEHTRDDMEMNLIKLGSCIENSLEPMKKMAEIKNIQLSVKLNQEVQVMGNESALTRLTNNLISNAIKFTPAGGTIDVGMEDSEGGYVEVRVRDSGIGIPKDKISKIFDAFSTASRKGTEGEGTTGLGLSICQKIAQMHGGSINVESEENQGSSFIVSFPIAKKTDSEKLAS